MDDGLATFRKPFFAVVSWTPIPLPASDVVVVGLGVGLGVWLREYLLFDVGGISFAAWILCFGGSVALAVGVALALAVAVVGNVSAAGPLQDYLLALSSTATFELFFFSCYPAWKWSCQPSLDTPHPLFAALLSWYTCYPG